MFYFTLHILLQHIDPSIYLRLPGINQTLQWYQNRFEHFPELFCEIQ